LSKGTGVTDGNLGSHIETLAKAGYVAVDKALSARSRSTAAGRSAFARHVVYLREIIEAGAGP
jgi:hypothetical protein